MQFEAGLSIKTIAVQVCTLVALNAHIFTLHLHCSSALFFVCYLGSLVAARVTGLLHDFEEG